MTELHHNPNVADITESLYYKTLKKDLKNKKVVQDSQKITLDNALTQFAEQELGLHEDIQETHGKKSKKRSFDEDYFKDNVILQSSELKDMLADKKKTIDDKKIEAAKETFKFNGKEIMKNLAHKIDFSAKKNEFKEMFKYNVQESRSHDTFISRFSEFKVGVIGQILVSIGVPIDELKQLKKASFQALFEENCAEMSENVYNSELNGIIHGTKKRARRTARYFSTLQVQLIKKMHNIGRIGYWSKIRLMEEKMNQCKKIKQEFIEEKQHLEYLLSFIQQKQGSHD